MRRFRSNRPDAGGRFAALSFAFIISLGSPAGWAEPYVPDNDSAVVEQLPAASSRPAKTLRGLRALLAGAPDQIDLALRVAHDEIALGRADGDPRYYGRAEAALAPWLRLDDPPTAILLARATLRQNRHEFDSALSDLDRVIAAEPADAEAILIRATVRQVMGDYDRARSDCAELGPLAVEAVSRICRATIDGLTGDSADAIAQLAVAGDALEHDNQPSLLLWGLTLLGETAERSNRLDEAEIAFRRALDLKIRDVYLLGAYSDLLLDRNRPAAVVALLTTETRIDPLLLRLAIAERMLNSASADRHIADLSERFEASRRRGDTVHRREEARFALTLLGDPDRALNLARANWDIQKEPWDARLLVEAALAARKPDEALTVRQWIAKTGLEDAALDRLLRRLDES